MRRSSQNQITKSSRSYGLGQLQAVINYINSPVFTREQKIAEYRKFSEKYYAEAIDPPIDWSRVPCLEL